MTKKYGLVWEDHKEPIEELLETHDVILEEVKEREIKSGEGNSPQHLLIEGDNYESLTYLKQDFLGKVNVIYIDPPYNTKNKFKYSDNYGHHSKWLSFMEKRLKLAKDLMSEDGVIFISIDDNEFAQLKLLCDEVFGYMNFISNISWHKGYGKNDSCFFRNTTEYILCYAKNLQSLKKHGIEFKVQKNGYSQLEEIVANFKQSGNNDHKLLEQKVRKFLRENKGLKGISAYNKVEENTLRIYSGVTLEDPKGSNYYYDVIHPKTGKACKMPNKGWNRPQSSMELLLSNDEILFGKDETTIPRRKYYLDKMEHEVPHNFIDNSNQGGSDIKNIFGKAIFTYPKPISLINYLLSICSNKNSIVLDFFAGSGTTGHAVLELNQEDGGSRQFILCTNNENNICEEVTYERLKKVVEGYTTAKGKVVEGIPANLTYYKTKLAPKEGV